VTASNTFLGQMISHKTSEEVDELLTGTFSLKSGCPNTSKSWKSL